MESTFNRFKLRACVAIFALLPLSALSVDIELSPNISSSFIHVTEGERLDANLSDAQAWLINPELGVSFSGAVWQGNWNVKHTEIQQVDSEFEDSSYTDITLNNSFSWWQDRLQLSLSGNRRNQNINRGQGGVSDPVFANQEFVDVDDFSGQISLSNRPRSLFQTQFNYSYSETDFDERQLENTESTSTSILKGGRHSASLTFSRNISPEQVKGTFSISANENERENRGDQSSMTSRLDIGIPIWGDFDLALNGYKSRSSVDNSTLTSSFFDTEYYGAGLAWRFGRESYLLVTRNRTTQGEGDEFTSLRLNFLPSERTSLSYEKSKRFYGESHSFSLAYAASRLSLNSSYKEELTSRTRLVGQAESVGNFLCPFEFELQEDCEAINGFPNFIPDNFFVTEFFQTAYSVDEEVVLNRSANFQLSYRLKKADLSVNYSRTESEYLERLSLRDTETFGINFSHKMTRRNTFSLSANQSRSMDRAGTEYRTGYKVEASFERRLTRKADGSVSIKKLSNESNTGQQNRKDTRIEVTYSYKF